MAAELLCTAETMQAVVDCERAPGVPGHKTALLWSGITIIFVLIALLYSRILEGMFQDWWTQPAWSHGLLIPPLAFYIAWIRRAHTLAEGALHDSLGLFVVAGACFLYLLGKLGAEFFLARISFVVLLVGVIWTFWGRRRLRTLAFPLLLFATMVPLPVIVFNALATPLQLFASECATSLAQLAGISVYRDGNVIHLAHTSLGVEEACSGLNSLSALIVASLLLGFLSCSRLRTRVLLVLVSVPLAVAVNIVRVTGTAILADLHEEFALGFYHVFSGWLVFLVGFGTLYGATTLVHRWLD
jgi:exosortase